MNRGFGARVINEDDSDTAYQSDSSGSSLSTDYCESGYDQEEDRPASRVSDKPKKAGGGSRWGFAELGELLKQFHAIYHQSGSDYKNNDDIVISGRSSLSIMRKLRRLAIDLQHNTITTDALRCIDMHTSRALLCRVFSNVLHSSLKSPKSVREKRPREQIASHHDDLREPQPKKPSLDRAGETGLTDVEQLMSEYHGNAVIMDIRVTLANAIISTTKIMNKVSVSSEERTGLQELLDKLINHESALADAVCKGKLMWITKD